MGNVQSAVSPKSAEVNPSWTLNTGSDEVKSCEKCTTDFMDSVYCDRCKKTLCSQCCPHQIDIERKKTNLFYGKELVVVSVGKIWSELDNKNDINVYSMILAEHGVACVYGTRIRTRNGYSNYYRDEWVVSFMENQTISSSEKLGSLCYSEIKKEIYVTVPDKRKVYTIASFKFCGTSYKLKVAFGTPLGSCFGITTFDKGLALSIRVATDFSLAKWQIHFIDFNGKIKGRIQNDAEGKPLFEEPTCLTSNRSETTLLVCDKKKGIMALNTNGNILFAYSGHWSATCLAVDCYSNIYIAAGNKLIQIDYSNKTEREILKVTGGKRLVSVCFDHNTRVLWTVQECGTVTSFYFQGDKL